MFKVTKYPHGTFAWADCASTDVAKAKPFYIDLFGWETEDMPMGDGTFYTMFKQDGEYVTAIGGIQDPSIPSVWNNYISVDDVDALVSKIKDLGGTIIAGPFDIFDSGRMMSAQDPTGAMISFWQPKNHKGAGIVNTVGTMAWNELNTRDAQAAKDFYSKLLGWKLEADERGYLVIMNNNRPNGGIMEMDENWGDIPPHWTTYFNCSDIDATVEKVTKLGGKINMPIQDAPGVGRLTSVADPSGAHFMLIQLIEPQPWDA